MYLARVAAMTSSGRGGGASPDVRSQPEVCSSQSRTNCLSYGSSRPPGCQVAASQNLEESGVSTSSCCPSGALVVGVEIGSGSREPSRSPLGSLTPQTVPVCVYSAQPDPVR